jgi:hypothetical protein
MADYTDIDTVDDDLADETLDRTEGAKICGVPSHLATVGVPQPG